MTLSGAKPWQVRLIGVGMVPTIPAREVKAGMLRLYNYGHASPVVEVRHDPNWVQITVRGEDGKLYTHRHRPETRIPVEGPTLVVPRRLRVRVRPAGWPRLGQWVVEWRTPSMGAPAFEYLDTYEAAVEWARNMAGTAARTE